VYEEYRAIENQPEDL
jgi:hypothetical protein